MSKEKDFINVASLGAEFNAWMDHTHVRVTEGQPAPSSNELHWWQVQAQMAIAQQLTMIAKHLSQIVGHAEERSKGSA